MGGGVEIIISLLFMALLLSVNFVASVAEGREIYLVLMEGHPVAFHRGYSRREDGRRVEPNRFGFKNCGNILRPKKRAWGRNPVCIVI